MPSLKEEALQAIAEISDNATLDDIIYKLYVVEKIRQGRADIVAGNLLTAAQVHAEVKSW